MAYCCRACRWRDAFPRTVARPAEDFPFLLLCAGRRVDDGVCSVRSAAARGPLPVARVLLIFFPPGLGKRGSELTGEQGRWSPPMLACSVSPTPPICR